MKTCDVCRTEWSESLDNGRCPRCEREQLRQQLASAEERVKELERERDDARAKWRDDQLRADNARLAAEVERLRSQEKRDG